MYQLIGITIDFFAFKTITKIDVKSNENDFNYPFITLSIEDSDKDNNCFKDYFTNFGLEDTFGIFDGDLSDIKYEENCNYSYLPSILNSMKRQDPVNWKIHFLLNCRKKSLPNLIEWNNFNNKLKRINLQTKENYSNMKFGWYLTNSNDDPSHLMFAFITLEFKVENKFIKFQRFLHLDSEEYKVNNIFLHSTSIPNFSEIPMVSFHFMGKNSTIIVRKVLRSYLEPPFGNCSHYYPQIISPFNATNHMQCYQKMSYFICTKTHRMSSRFHRLINQ